MPLNSIWLDSRLNELSIESKNTQKRSPNEGVMHIASREENQQLAATVVAAAATVFCHFRTYYKLNIVSIYIWMDFRLKGIFIESKNTQNGVRTKKLWSSEVGGLTLCRGYALAWNPML